MLDPLLRPGQLSLASHPYFSRAHMGVVISGWRKGKKNTSGDYGPDFVSLCQNLCGPIRAQQACDNICTYVAYYTRDAP